MDRHWERTIPYIHLDVPTAQHLLHAFDGTCAIEHMTLLSDGKRNTNYKVTLKGIKSPCLLRIFGANDSWWEKEQALYHRVKSLMPVPHLYFMDSGTSEIQKPYAVYEYLDGTTMEQCSGRVSDRILTQLGEALAQLHAIAYDQIGFFGSELQIVQKLPPVQQWYPMFLGRYARRKLGISLVRQVERYVAYHQDAFAAIDAQKALVHGDFRPTNIMVKGDTVQGIIDWEGAMAGHPLADIGQFLRYSDQVDTHQEQVFIDSYKACARMPLPEPYFHMAKLRDLVNLLQMVNVSATLPYKDQDMKRLIHRTVTEGA